LGGEMSMSLGSPRISAVLNVLAWLAILLVAAFYLVSTLGWAFATIMLLKGLFGEAASSEFASLGPIDHFMRVAQVTVICLVSIALLLRKKFAAYLFGVSLILSVITELFSLNWGVSYLGPGPTLFSFAVVLLLLRQRVLK
jgi:hypothetical protein